MANLKTLIEYFCVIFTLYVFACICANRLSRKNNNIGTLKSQSTTQSGEITTM